jgi:2Fe-2S ferredoxin
MPNLVIITRQGEQRQIVAATGRSLMEEIRNAGIDEMQALCGGCAACCTCHVFVARDRLADLPAMQEQEDELLASSDARTECSRLACQVPVTDALDGMCVTIAPDE